jgi:CBS domain-containing protein
VLQRAQALLREFLEQEVAMPFVADAMTHIYDALVERALQHAAERMEAEGYGAAPAPWCWLALGSEGREEQMLRTDQDNALIFVAHSEEQARDYRPWFMRMAAVAGEVLALCGFEPCPGGIMASNPEWCRSLEEWKDACRAWIQAPHPENILRSAIFFDLRPVSGHESLAEELRAVIAEAADNELTMAFLAKHAVSTPPPLSFFRSFIVESDGEHRHEFDVKLRAITPIVDAARVLALAAGAEAPVSTLGRLRHLREREPANAEVMSDAAAAFELLLRHRTAAGLKAGDSGRFIDIAGLSKMERQALRSSFRAIRALQEVVSVRFNTDALR